MPDFQNALAQIAQFIAQRQLEDQQAPDAGVMPTVAAGTDPIYGGMMGQLPTLMSLAQASGGRGLGGNMPGGPSGNMVTEHGVTGDARAMSLLDRVAQQYPQLWNNVSSSYRTRAQQAQMYNDYLHHGGNLAAPPGHSNHELGLAFDINAGWIDSRPGLRELLNRLGGFPVGGEPWHWQPQFTI